VLIEVIVQSCADAAAAVRGGADRLEIVAAIDHGGLTPSVDLVRAIAAEAGLPLRVMVREHDAFTVDGPDEVARLQRAVDAFAALDVDGVVLGFARDGEPDVETTRQVLSAAPLRATYHRAFDTLRDPLAAIDALRALPQIDRILTDGGGGTVPARCARWQAYAARAGTRSAILAGGGLDDEVIAAIAATRCVPEIHVGRAARQPPLAAAPVCAARVRRLREIVNMRAG
jgi:copper homeostasis protein